MMSDNACPDAPMLACRKAGAAARALTDKKGPATAPAATVCRNRLRETGEMVMGYDIMADAGGTSKLMG
jgi:hypothetical protein